MPCSAATSAAKKPQIYWILQVFSSGIHIMFAKLSNLSECFGQKKTPVAGRTWHYRVIKFKISAISELEN